MSRAMKKMLIGVAILFGIVFGYKAFQTIMTKRFISHMKNESTVSTMKVGYQEWKPQIEAAGSLRAKQGVDVTTEVGGIVQKIVFTPGAKVKVGDVLVQLNADADIAQLHSYQANAQLAKAVYKRDKSQYAIGAISKATLDADAADLKSKTALMEQQAALVAKKTIRAPFTGRLGISAVNLGQYLNPGNKIVSLQNLDPIYADFYVPQQQLTVLKTGQTVYLDANNVPGKTFTGAITTIDPSLDPNTRNVEIEATLPNANETLTPGMFGTVKVDTGAPQRYLTLPQTAITFNPYGNIVFLVKHDDKDKNQLIAMQSFVTTGETRGDQITILQGLKEGDEVITSGQMKLKNGSPIVINNSVQPPNNPAPKTTDQ